MELIEIIKSSILLFSLALIVIVIISFGLFKLRNQAKKKRLTEREEENRKFLHDNQSGEKKLKSKSDESNQKTESISAIKIKNSERFIVVNEKQKNLSTQGFRINYHPNVYKFYEEIESSEMFKIKPVTNNHS